MVAFIDGGVEWPEAQPYCIVFKARTEISVLVFVDRTGNLGYALRHNKWNLC